MAERKSTREKCRSQSHATALLVLLSGRVVAALLVAGVLARIVHRIVASPAGNLGLVH